MNPARVTYTPGGWLAVVGARTWALIELDVDDPRVEQLWEAAETGVDDILDVLLRGGLRSLPGFAIAGLGDRGLRYAVRRPGILTLPDTTGETIDGSDDGPWAGGWLTSLPGSFTLAGGADRVGVVLPTGSGVTPAGSVAVLLGGAELDRDTGPVVETETEAETETNGPAPGPGGREDAEPLVDDEPPLDEDPATDEEQPADEAAGESHASTYYQLLVSSTTERDALLSKLHGEGEREGEGEDEQVPKPTSEATSVWTGEPDVSLPTDGAERAAAPPHAGLPLVAPPMAGPQLAAQPDTAQAAPSNTDPQVGAGDSVIDGLPWAKDASASPPTEPLSAAAATGPPTPSAPADPPTPPAPTEPASEGAEVDAMSVTINRAALVRQLEQQRSEGPTLLALRCALGHLSPSYAVNCRVCDTELEDQSPIEVVRPPLGQLVLSNGSSVVLDRGVIFGRSPQSDVEDAAQRPNLVRLIDSAEISRMHASVTLDGWQVLLRDLGSQNGTILTLPGREPEQIRPHEDYMLEPGSVVSFADVVSCTFEVTT